MPIKSIKRKEEEITMKISTKGRYALRLLVDIAANSEGGPVSIKDVSKRENISDKYLEQIISSLNSAGLVRSVRGPQGGYLLRKPSEDITVGMVLRITEGGMSPVTCLEDGAESCDKQAACTTLKLWKRLDDAINDVIDNTTIADLVNDRPNAADEYII